MSGHDELDPIHNEELPSGDLRDSKALSPSVPSAGVPNTNPPSTDLPADDLADEPAFHFPAIPIAPTRGINAPANRILASGDDLLDFVRDPLRHTSPKPAQRREIPDDLDPELFAKPLTSDPNVPASATTRADRLTDAIRPDASEIETDPAFEQYPAPDFPITPIAPPNFRLEPEPVTRIPNFGHLGILFVIASLGFLAAAVFVQIAFHLHLWGVTTLDKAATDIHYTLASMAVLYIVSFAGAFFFFPLVWHKSFFAGLQWNASAAVRYLGWLFGAASFCFILALVDELILPSPSNAPIDKMFSSTAAAWLLFGFGVLVAPCFEEMTFRGFLLPALCTTCDWLAEYARSESQWSRPALIAGSAVASSALVVICEQKFGHHQPLEWLLVSCFIAVVCGLAISWLYQRYQALGAGSRVRPLGPNGHPRWSLAAIIVGSLLTSLPFAAMHAEQIAHSFGPLVLLYCVSLVLCFVRLATRSLAASTLVHASYNFLLFFFMLVGTGGFKHLDKM
jgi:hypothetical protein